MSRIATVLVTGLIVLTLGEATDARSFRPAMLPNAPDGGNTCHTSGGGTPRNAFGLDVEAIVGASEQQFWSAELAALDSYGDGVSNGWELGDPDGDGDPDPTIPLTSPGDALAPGSELDFLYSLLSEFDADRDLVLFAGDARFHPLEQGLLFDFADELGWLGRADLERAIASFEGGAPGAELDFLY